MGRSSPGKYLNISAGKQEECELKGKRTTVGESGKCKTNRKCSDGGKKKRREKQKKNGKLKKDQATRHFAANANKPRKVGRAFPGSGLQE